MRRSLKAEMRRQVKSLGHAIDAVYTCATELDSGRHYWRLAKPRAK